MLLLSANGKNWLFDPHKFITNYLNTDFPTIPQSDPKNNSTYTKKKKYQICRDFELAKNIADKTECNILVCTWKQT